ncbi:hypothetical protein MSAR_09090 [Mycolicibacterium sarraceniae]|uniref:Acetyl-coenzyme A carboxylase carboxyl transferase subunit beta domain-containing protein n=1 Tax=Mycolicibacterium sarraceniae TaxID=1534348 RepID=A0A7I7SLZ7_9MYCO|nr:hypothetical protein MSAR_09090 [Mycolicibacterium sarraceniae]
MKEATGEDISKEDLGGPTVALSSGVIHNYAETDESVLDAIRRYLSYFPSSAWSYPPTRLYDEDVGLRPTPELLDIVSRGNRNTYDMRAVLDVVFDDTDWLEVQPTFGQAIICALAHFITVADSFHLPVVFLADNPGMLPGSQSERNGVLRSGAGMFAAQTAATTLKLHVTLRKAFGFGSMVTCLCWVSTIRWRPSPTQAPPWGR